MNEEELERVLNESDFDFSGDDDDDEYIPPEDLQYPEQLAESDEEEGPSEQHTQEEVLPSRLFWRTKEMSARGPDIADDELISQGTSEINVLHSFFEYLGQHFWDLVAEQTNLYSAQKRDHRSVNTNSIELIRFSGVLMMMGTLKYPQGKLYWNRDLCVPIIQEAITRQRFYELRNFLHFVNVDKYLGQTLENTTSLRFYSEKMSCVTTLPTYVHRRPDDSFFRAMRVPPIRAIETQPTWSQELCAVCSGWPGLGLRNLCR